MFSFRSKRLRAGLAGVSLLALAACSSQGGAQNQGGATPAESERLTIAMVTHGAASDAFWSQIQTGGQEAAAKDNVDLRYSGSGQIPEQSTFIQNAIDSKVDGIIVTLPDPGALTPVIQKAVAAGIPVVAINAGDRDWDRTVGELSSTPRDGSLDAGPQTDLCPPPQLMFGGDGVGNVVEVTGPVRNPSECGAGCRADHVADQTYRVADRHRLSRADVDHMPHGRRLDRRGEQCVDDVVDVHPVDPAPPAAQRRLDATQQAVDDVGHQPLVVRIVGPVDHGQP